MIFKFSSSYLKNLKADWLNFFISINQKIEAEYEAEMEGPTLTLAVLIRNKLWLFPVCLKDLNAIYIENVERLIKSIFPVFSVYRQTAEFPR